MRKYLVTSDRLTREHPVSYVTPSPVAVNPYRTENQDCVPVSGSFLMLIFTVRNIVAAMLCFHRRLSFCARWGGAVDTPQCRHHPCLVHAGIHPPPGDCSRWYASYWNAFFFFFLNWKTSVLFCFATDTPLFRFKTRVDHLLACFITCMQWIPQIHLWCNTAKLLMISMAIKPFWSTYLYTKRKLTLMGLQSRIECATNVLPSESCQLGTSFSKS